jgi:hypothetical protein
MLSSQVATYWASRGADADVSSEGSEDDGVPKVRVDTLNPELRKLPQPGRGSLRIPAVSCVASEAGRARQVVDHPRRGARAEVAPPSSGGVRAGVAEAERG